MSWFFKSKNLQCVFGQVDIIARIQIKNLLIELSSKTVELSNDMLMGESKPLAPQNLKFED